MLRRVISALITVTFLFSLVILPTNQARAGEMVALSQAFTPAQLEGISIHPDDPFKFDFIINRGDEPLSHDQKQVEYKKLIKYFLASLTVPDTNQWVNLSPYEKDRIIESDFGKTEMGRDLLSEDYLLKQLTASLIYPENGLGQKFWDRVYAESYRRFGKTNVPINTFNKVWIVPDGASIYEKGNTAYVIKDHLKVMLEQDYLSQIKHQYVRGNTTDKLGSQVVREIILPALEREVNEGKNFAMLRQVYSGMILAAWYKRALKDSLLSKVYADRLKLKGIDQNDAGANKAIYQRYLQDFKKGVFNFIKDDEDKYTHQRIPRKYFSGGILGMSGVAMAREHGIDFAQKAAELVEHADAAEVSLGPAIYTLGGYSLPPEEQYRLELLAGHMDRSNSSLSGRLSFDPADLEKIDESLRRNHEPNHESIPRGGVRKFIYQYRAVTDAFSSSAVPRLADAHKIFLRLTDVALSIEGESPEIRAEKLRIQYEALSYVFRMEIMGDNSSWAPWEFIGAALSIKEEDAKSQAAQDAIYNFLTHTSTLDNREKFRTITEQDLKFVSGGKTDDVILARQRAALAYAQYERLRVAMIGQFGAKGHEIQRWFGPLTEAALRINNPSPRMRADIALHMYDELLAASRRDGEKLSPIAVADLTRAAITDYSWHFKFPAYGSTYAAVDKDRAMMHPQIHGQKIEDLGGIDMNAANLSMNIKRDGKGVALPVSQQDMAQFSHMEGLDLKIIQIRPASSLPLMNELKQNS